MANHAYGRRRVNRLNEDRRAVTPQSFGGGGAWQCKRRQPPLHDERHQQRSAQHHQPHQSFCPQVVNPHQPQAKPGGRSQGKRSHRRFQQNRQHHFFSPLTREIFPARACSSFRSSTSLSTSPTSKDSTEPSQNQSAMRFTARAATCSRGAAER